MSLDFADLVGLSVLHASRETQKERNLFYQECNQQIVDAGTKASNLALEVIGKASSRYIPKEVIAGCSYLALYAFALVLEKQRCILKKQRGLMKLYFQTYDSLFPFTQAEFLTAAIKGQEVGNFREIISISKSHLGAFWNAFFRALYKSGTKQDLKDMEDYMTSIIQNFVTLGDPRNRSASEISLAFVSSVDYQMNHLQETPISEIDMFSEIPVRDHLDEMKRLYADLLNGVNALDDASEEEKTIQLELPFLPFICDLVMMTKQPKTTKMKMIDDATAYMGINTILTAEDYIKEIANNTKVGQSYKNMFSAGSPIGTFWTGIFRMGMQMYGTEDVPMSIVNNIFSILIQVENYLDEKYQFLGGEHLAMDYMLHILEQTHEELTKEG